MRNALVAFAVLSVAGSAAAEVRFTAGPTVARDGTGARIEFAVSGPTDVEVAVLDAGGKVARRLAAGVLGGPNPPPAPLKAGLAQTIVWDGKDDAGTLIHSGDKAADGLKVRVRLGMSAKFGRIIGASPYVGQATDQPYRGSLPGIAIDGQGNLLVKMMSSMGSHGNSGLWPWQLRKFDSEGNYVKTLLPYPPSTDPERAAGMTLIATPDRQFAPANQSSLYPVLFNFGSVLCPALVDGSAVFVNTRARQLHFFKVDGSNRLRTVPMWPAKDGIKSPAWLEADVAFSSDGRYAYYSGLAGTVYDGKTPADTDPDWPNGRVYRHDLRRPQVAPEPFFDLTLPDFNQTKYWIPSAWDHRCASGGIDVDPKGNVYIGDLVNQQIAVVSPEGRRIETLDAPWPDRVRVHPTTGDLYVVERVVSRGGRPPCRVYKISRSTGSVVAELKMKRAGNVELALDARGQTPLLWVLGPGEGPSGQGLFRVEDRGAELVVTKDIFDRDHDAIAFVGNLTVDPDNDQVYVTNTASRTWRFDGASGRGGVFAQMPASDLAIHDGAIYRIIGWNSGIARFSLDGRPDPLEDLSVPTRQTRTPGVLEFGSYYGRAGRGCSVGGLTVGPDGRLWALQEGGGTGGYQAMFVKAYNPDGTAAPFQKVVEAQKEEIPAAITGLDNRAGCIRTDAAGNVYIGWGQVLREHKPPAGFETDDAYRVTGGVALKFGPEGGHRPLVQRGAKDPEGTVMGFTGVKQIYEGLAPFSAWRADGSCICAKPRFDLDGFGRLFLPNAITYSVAIVDNAANPIVRFGHYGNFDAQGPGSAEPKPQIPLGWPIGVGVAGDRVYIGDVLNHRIVRVDLSYATEQTVPIK